MTLTPDEIKKCREWLAGKKYSDMELYEYTHLKNILEIITDYEKHDLKYKSFVEHHEAQIKDLQEEIKRLSHSATARRVEMQQEEIEKLQKQIEKLQKGSKTK